MPRDIVRVVPQYRDYEYTVVRDEIVIVEPRTRRVVEVLPREGGTASRKTTTISRESGGSSRLTSEQRSTVISELRSAGAQTSGTGGGPSGCLQLSELPPSLADRMPELRGYKYVSIGDDIVLVDPQSRKVSVLDQ